MSCTRRGHRPLLSRRELLGAGTGLGLIGLAGLLAEEGARAADPVVRDPLSPKPPHFRPRAKRIIHLYMNGGPSQVDTFDPKPAAQAKFEGQRPSEHCSVEDREWHRRTAAVAVQIPPPRAGRLAGQRDLPRSRSLRGRSLRPPLDAHQRAQPRAVDVHDEQRPRAGDPSQLRLLAAVRTGDREPEPAGLRRPRHGAARSNGSGQLEQTLFFVQASTRAPTSTCPPRSSRATVSPTWPNTTLSTESQQPPAGSWSSRVNALQVRASGDMSRMLDARIESFEMAFRMQAAAPEAFDLSRGAGGRSARDSTVSIAAGDGIFAMNCLLARRLVERGVRVVQVYSGNFQPWDTHEKTYEPQHRTVGPHGGQAGRRLF